MGVSLYESPDSVFDIPDAPADPKPTPPDDAENYVGLGRLLDMAQEDPDKCAKELVKDFERQDPAMVRRKVFWDMYQLMNWGVRGVRVNYPVRQDLNQVRLYVPLGAMEHRSPMDRCDMLCERVTAHLLADPPMPSPEAANESDDARDAAEFSKKVLLAEAGEGGSNYQAKFRRAHKKAAIYGSTFIHVWCDSTGGGKQDPAALSSAPATIGSAASSAGVPSGESQSYSESTDLSGEQADPDGDAPQDAAPVTGWNPKLCLDVLDGRNVRFIPEQVDGIGDSQCRGAQILKIRTMGQLRDEFPELRKNGPDGKANPDYIGDEKVIAMANWRNVAMLWCMPWYLKMGYETSPVMDDDGVPSNASLVGCLMVYYKTSPEYPKGAYLYSAGDAYLLHAAPWVAEIQGADGVTREETLDIPLAQIRQFDDTDGDDPYGFGLVRKIGPADEVRGSIVMAKLDHIDRYSRPNTFLPMGSIIQPEALQQHTGEPIYFNPTGVPVVEEVPAFDATSLEFFQEADGFQDSVSGLGETAQALEVPTVTSGVQQQGIVSQSTLNLALQKQNLADAIERTWRLMLQQIRAWYTVPQLLKYTSEDGDYTQRAWSSADLGDTKDVKIAIGSFTQQTPDAKIQTAISYSQIRNADGSPALLQDPDEFQRIIADGLNPQLGMSDNPAVQRVRGQIAMFKRGPSPQWLGQFQQFQAAQQHAQQQASAEAQQAAAVQAQKAAQAAAMQPPPAAPVPGVIPINVPTTAGAPPSTPQRPSAPPPQPDPKQIAQRAQQLVQQSGASAPASIFVRMPSDLIPTAATFRHRELYRLTQSKALAKFPEPWQQMALAEYEAMRQAAGIMTISEQQQLGIAQQQMGVQGQIQVEKTIAQGRVQVEQAKTAGEAQHTIIKQGAETQSVQAIDSHAIGTQNIADRQQSAQAHAQDMEKTIIMATLAPATAPPDLKAAASQDAERELAGV